MGYALAPSLVVWRAELNARWPQRDKTSDGWIGDTAHSARVSDHNVGARNLVHAFDSDEDLDGNPADGGPELAGIAEMLRASQDHRVKYVIYEGRIFAGRFGPAPWAWRTYSGVNAHRRHLHLSIHSTVAAETDTRSWFPAMTPHVPQEDDMPTPAELVAALNQAAAGGQLDDFFQRSGTVLRDVTKLARADQSSAIAALIRQLDVGADETEIATAVLAALTPQAIAAAIPDAFAAQVVDELHRRTAPTG